MINPNSNARRVMSGHHRCGLALRLEEALNRRHIDYEWRDVQEGKPCFRDELRRLGRGHGTPGTPGIRATTTLTLALPKTGLLAPSARMLVGDLYLADTPALALRGSAVQVSAYRRNCTSVWALKPARSLLRI